MGSPCLPIRTVFTVCPGVVNDDFRTGKGSWLWMCYDKISRTKVQTYRGVHVSHAFLGLRNVRQSQDEIDHYYDNLNFLQIPA